MSFRERIVVCSSPLSRSKLHTHTNREKCKVFEEGLTRSHRLQQESPCSPSLEEEVCEVWGQEAKEGPCEKVEGGES